MLPPLPPMSGPIKFDYRLNDTPTEGEIYFYTKEQMLQLQRDTWNAAISACIHAYSPDDSVNDYTDKMVALLKELP